MKKFSTFLIVMMIFFTSSICFAENFWKGDPNYPIIKYYSPENFYVAVKNSAHYQTLSNERVIIIKTYFVHSDGREEDAFWFKKFGNEIYFTNNNSSIGSPTINWKFLNKNNPEHQPAWKAYKVAAEFLGIR